MRTTRESRRATPRHLVAIAALATAGAAQAAVTAPAGPGFADYGNGGNLFELAASLFVQGLGNAGDPASVVALNEELSFSESSSGFGTGLVTLDYVVNNIGVSAFGPMRFMLFTNPDGDGTTFLDSVSEAWGAGGGGEPVRREARAFTVDPFATITARFRATGQLDEGPTAVDAACAVSCDAVIGLQWDLPNLGPGESWHIAVGLSDDGQALSTRWIDATSVNAAGTAMRVSGLAQVIPVPEPASVWMLAAGLAVLGAAAGAQQRRQR